MYDGLTGRYTFACPVKGEVRLPLSAFRVIERLPGASHPAIYKITSPVTAGTSTRGSSLTTISTGRRLPAATSRSST